MIKPNIVISACLTGDNVRYNGEVLNCFFLEKLSKYVNIIKVCPEVSIGLPVPREPIVVVNREKEIFVINPKTKEDFTERLKSFSKDFLSTLKNIDGFFLKSKSPSCGISGTKTYKNLDGTGFLYRGKGIFAKVVKETFPYIPIEDEQRIKNWDRKYFFLLRIFLNKDLRVLNIEDFHKKYRFTLHLLNRKKALFLDKAIKDKNEYRSVFKDLFIKMPSEKVLLKRIERETGLTENSFKNAFRKLLKSKEKYSEEVKNFLSIVPDDIIF